MKKILLTFIFFSALVNAQFKAGILVQSITPVNMSLDTVLNEVNITSDFILKADITTTNLSQYNLLIVDFQTGGWPNWGDSVDVAFIKNSGVKVLGAGSAGGYFFKQYGSVMDQNYATNQFDSAVSFRDIDNILLQEPNVLTLNSDSTLVLYNNDSYSYGYIPQYLTGPIEILGYSVTNNLAGVIVYENGNYMWGQMDGFSKMTPTGKKLFQNLAYMIAKQNPVTVVSDKNLLIDYSLSQNYPNPFNPTTKINYSVAQPGTVKITVFDVLGKVITELVNEVKPAGNYNVEFNGSDLSSGIYFYKMAVGSFSISKKFVLLK